MDNGELMYAMNEVTVHATGKYQPKIHARWIQGSCIVNRSNFFSKITLTTPAAAALNKNESNAEDEDKDEGEEDDNMYSDDNASMINQDDTKPYNFYHQ